MAKKKKAEVKIPLSEYIKIEWNDSKEFEQVQCNVIDNGDDHMIHDVVIKRKSDGKFFRRELPDDVYVDDNQYDEDEPWVEVEPYTETVTRYK